MVRKQPEVTAATRQKLIDAFWEQLAEHEISKITVKSITDAAGYNRGTFYQYFSDVPSVAEYEERRLMEGIERLNPPGMVKMGRGDLLQSVFVPFLEQNADKIALLVQRRGDAFLARIREELYPFFLAAYGVDDDAEARVLFGFLLGGITNALVAWRSEEIPISKVFAMMLGIATKGLVPTLTDGPFGARGDFSPASP